MLFYEVNQTGTLGGGIKELVGNDSLIREFFKNFPIETPVKGIPLVDILRYVCMMCYFSFLILHVLKLNVYKIYLCV